MQLEIKSIKKKYGKKEILNDITFNAPAGTGIGILGTNGSGKSTLLSILAGVRKCDSGECIWNGENILRNRKHISEVIGYVPQGTPLFDELTAKDNLLLWYDRKDMEEQLKDGILAMLGISDFINTTVSRMSGGMKKRLSIGCAVAKRPPVLLLDEPGAALDIVCHESIVSYLQEYKKKGGTFIISTHDQSDLVLCDALYILKNGVLKPYTYDGNVERLVGELQ